MAEDIDTKANILMVEAQSPNAPEDIKPYPMEEMKPIPREEINSNPTEEINSNAMEETNPNPSEEINHNLTEETQPNPIEEINSNVKEEINLNPIEEINSNPTEEIISNPIEEINSNPMEETNPNSSAEINHNLTEEINPNPVEEINSNPLRKNLSRMIKIVQLPRPYSKEELVNFIKELTNEEVVNGMHATVRCTVKNKSMALLTFTTPDLAQQTLMALMLQEIRAYLGTYAPNTWANVDRINKIPPPTKEHKKKTCYVCQSTKHYSMQCPQKSLNKPNPASTDDTDKTPPPAKELRKIICHSCKNPGHYSYSKNCPQNVAPITPNTASTDDSAPTTPKRKKCFLCESTDHLAKHCPQKGPEGAPSTSSADDTAQAAKRPASDDPATSVAKKHKNNDSQGIKVLTLKNVPLTWNRAKMEAYIKEHTKSCKKIFESVQYIYMKKRPKQPDIQNWKRFNGVCHVWFASAEHCAAARALLGQVNVKYDGKKIWTGYETNDIIVGLINNRPNLVAMRSKENKLMKQNVSATNLSSTARQQPNIGTYQNNFDNPSSQYISNVDSTIFGNSANSYGLSIHYLESIGVKSPLVSQIFVKGLPKEYDDENMIRSLFSHAGTVTSVAVVQRNYETLKVKVGFDHPVEAVQAISMFHEQKLYGHQLHVQLDTMFAAHRQDLPAGLSALGPGLGQDGHPLKNVRSTIDLQNAVNLIMNKIAVFETGNDQWSEKNQANVSRSVFSEGRSSEHRLNTNSPTVGNNIQDTLASLASCLTNPAANNPLLALGALLNPQTSQRLHLVTQQNAGNNLVAGLNTQQQVNPQPQASTSWNVAQPADVQNTQPNQAMQLFTQHHAGNNLIAGLNTTQQQVNPQPQVSASWNVAQPADVQNTQPNQAMQLFTQHHAGNNLIAGLNTTQQQVNPQPQVSASWNVAQPADVQNTQPSQALQFFTQHQAGSNLIAGLNTTQQQVNPQLQASISWNVAQPADVQNTLGQNYNMPGSMQGQNWQGVPNMQGVASMQDRYVQSVGNTQDQNKQAVAFMQDHYAQSVANMQGLNWQGVPDKQGVASMQNHYVQSVANVQTQNKQSLPHKQDVASMQERYVQSVSNMQDQRTKSVPDKQNVASMQNHYVQSVPNVQIQNEQNLLHKQDVASIQERYVQSVSNMQDQRTKSVPDKQNVASMQNHYVQSVPNVQIQNEQNLLHKQDVASIQERYIQSVSKMQDQRKKSVPDKQNVVSMQDDYVQSVANTQGRVNVSGRSHAQRELNKPKKNRRPQVQSEKTMLSGSHSRNALNMQSRSYTEGDIEKPHKRHDCTLAFNHLPPSVTEPALHAKMSEVGEVRLAVLTSPGRALVSFYVPKDAETCIKLFNRTKVDDQVIEVKYL